MTYIDIIILDTNTTVIFLEISVVPVPYSCTRSSINDDRVYSSREE